MRRVLEKAPDHARAHYLLGQALVAQMQPAAALEAFVMARDLDSLPWRVPTVSQEAVLRAAAEHSVPVCDLTARFREESPDGIIGWNLMDDHVHPTLAGQALTAEAILESMMQLDGTVRVSPEARARVAPRDEYAPRLGDNIFDRYASAHAMRILFAAPFLRENNPDAFERFERITTEIEQAMPSEVRDVLHEWQQTEPYAGSRCPVTAAVAQLLLKQGQYEEAAELYAIALGAVPEYTSWNLEYTYYSLYCAQKLQGGLTDQDVHRAHHATQQGRFLCQWVPSNYGFSERYTGFLHLLCREFAEAIPYLESYQDKPTGLDRLAVDQALILCYLQTGSFEKAIGLARAGAGRPGDYRANYQSLLDNLPAMIEAARNPAPSN
jgi:tetratricopeptide (TPR) repeat protein